MTNDVQVAQFQTRAGTIVEVDLDDQDEGVLLRDVPYTCSWFPCLNLELVMVNDAYQLCKDKLCLIKDVKCDWGCVMLHHQN